MSEETRKKLIQKYAKYFRECPEDTIEDVIDNLLNEYQHARNNI